MADWAGSARSNYFLVKDKTAFKILCSRWNIEYIEQLGKEEYVGFLTEGSLPSYLEGNDEVELGFDDFVKELSTHLQENHVAVMMDVGAEKLRYLTGYAFAINSKGDHVLVSLDDIYEKAKSLGIHITHATY